MKSWGSVVALFAFVVAYDDDDDDNDDIDNGDFFFVVVLDGFAFLPLDAV